VVCYGLCTLGMVYPSGNEVKAGKKWHKGQISGTGCELPVHAVIRKGAEEGMAQLSSPVIAESKENLGAKCFDSQIRSHILLRNDA
jgi:hypothetical protein